MTAFLITFAFNRVPLILSTALFFLSRDVTYANVDTETGKWTRVKQAVGVASKLYSSIYDSKVMGILGPISESNFRSIPITLLEDMSVAVKLSSAVYEKIVDGHPLSLGEEDRPDCVAQYDERTQTLWIISRGTSSSSDVITDTTWLRATAKVGQLDLPKGVVKSCNKIIPNLLNHLEVLKIRKTEIARICFTGHSLGGSTAIGLYLMWNLTDKGQDYRQISTTAITFGAPLVLSSPPEGFYKSTQGTSLSKNVHNIVTQLDIVPRLLGPHPLPTYTTEVYPDIFSSGYIDESLLGALFIILNSGTVHRTTYRSFGNFYSLRYIAGNYKESSRSFFDTSWPPEKSFHIGYVPNPETSLLNKYAGNSADILFGLYYDHDISRSRKAILAALRDAI